MNIVASFWEEHCTECAAPACYGTCGMFECGWHGRCVRVDGFEESVLGMGTMRFRRWGKIELVYHGRMMSDSAAARVERLNKLCRGLWRLLGKYHRALRWRLVALCGHRGLPTVWRIRMRSARDETLCAAIAYEDGREVFRAPLALTAGEEKVFELHIPIVNDRALFRLFPLNGEATGAIHLAENLLTTLTTNHQPLTTNIKCLAWDLDGTLWRGTLSEDGEEGLTLNAKAVDVVRELDRRGIVNSISSRNDLAEALAALKKFGIEEYFVFPQISWGPKSEGLRNLAKEMNIGLDAIAFIDDREEMRGEVRTNAPEVRVFAAEEMESLLARPEFNPSVSTESGNRRASYRAEMARRGAAKAFDGDYAAFLAASGLQFELLSVTGERIDRCRELVQRTNQLNLTARRYDEKAFAALLKSADCMAVHVWDKYGDYGIVGFLAMKSTHIVELCFSCRSAGRGIERQVLSAVAKGRKLTADIVEIVRNTPIREIIKEFV